MHAAHPAMLPPGGKTIVPTDIAMAIPKGYYGRLASRSGMTWKYQSAVHAGVIDSDYRGNIGVILFNHGKHVVSIKRGERIAQMVVEKIMWPQDIVEVDDLDETNRGESGYGSTGALATCLRLEEFIDGDAGDSDRLVAEGFMALDAVVVSKPKAKARGRKTKKTLDKKILEFNKQKKKDGAEGESRGALQPISAHIVMRIMYATRHARFDLYRVSQGLACLIHYWTLRADKELMQLVGYVGATLQHRMTSWIGDTPDQVRPFTVADADLAGCQRTLRSTSGGQLNFQGPKTFCPIAASSQRQTTVADSTPFAETVAAHSALK